MKRLSCLNAAVGLIFDGLFQCENWLVAGSIESVCRICPVDPCIVIIFAVQTSGQ